MQPPRHNTFAADLIKAEPKMFGFLKAGDLVEGKVIKKEGNKKLFLDLGRYGTGAVYGGELLNARDIVKNLKIGDAVHAKVINPDDENGYIELSLTEAGKQKAWEEVVELKEQEAILKVKPKAFNRGGLVVEISGLQAFLPVSQLSREHYPDVVEGDDKNKITQTLQKLVGKELSVRIIDANPRTKKLIISEKEASEVNVKELSKNYQVSQVIEGIISGVADFGVFIRFTDNPAVEGLIHISELSHRVVENPKEVIKVDQAMKAKIIDIKDGKIFLSLKALAADPWEKALDYYKEGQTVKGQVYSFNPFGAIINLENDLQGQIHVSAFGSVEEMKKQLEAGKEYSFLIEGIKPQEKRIILKLNKVT